MGLILKFNLGLLAIFLATFPVMDFALSQATLDDRLLGGLMVAAWCLALNLLLGWTVLRPMRRLTRRAEGLDGADGGTASPAGSGDEFARLASAFSRLHRPTQSAQP